MQYELSAEIIKILDDLAKRFGVAIDWADKNVMPYLIDLYERFIDYKIVLNIIPVILFVVCIIGVIILTTKYFKYMNLAKETEQKNWAIKVYSYYGSTQYDTTDLFDGLALILGIATGALGLVNIFIIKNLLELIFIPEVYMIEYLTNLM